MCGICGYISRDRLTESQFSFMNNTMRHRGPDDGGIETLYSDGWNVGLGHRRLSIIDLSMNAHQPMLSADRSVYVVFNGEIYNHRSLRDELSDYPYSSDSDTEVIIAAYQRWGKDKFIRRLSGMFAFALFDNNTKELILARDRVGKKPLYYWLCSDQIVFASELKAIMSFPDFRGKIRKDILARYLVNQYINAPDTIFEDVYKLEPGAYLLVKTGTNLKTDTGYYWKLGDVYALQSHNMIKGYNEAREELRDRIIKSVKERMVADVPIGFFLSGGYDSSLITAVGASVSATPIKTYSIGFNEKELDEADYARRVADYVGSEHTERYISESEMLDLVEKVPAYYDEPFADSSQIPTMLVSMLAARDVKVVLTGDGGDELFCGYSKYENVRIAEMLYPLSILLCGMDRVVPSIVERLPRKARVLSEIPMNKGCRTQILLKEYERIAQDIVNCGVHKPVRYLIEDQFSAKEWQEICMLSDISTYLPGDILCKVDRASMMYSLEARCPLLDTNVLEYSFSLPHCFKHHRHVGKYILKDIAFDYIPREFLDRKKQGFGVPLEKWLKGLLKDRLIELSDKRRIREQGLFEYNALQVLLRRFFDGNADAAEQSFLSRLLWSFLNLQNWYDCYKDKIRVD